MREMNPVRSPSGLTTFIAHNLRPPGMTFVSPMTATSKPMMAFEFPELSFLDLRRIIRAFRLRMLITP